MCRRGDAAEAGGCLARIAATPGTLNTFITPDGPAFPAADLSASPLAGVPMAYKDNISTRGREDPPARPKFWGTFSPYDATAGAALLLPGR